MRGRIQFEFAKAAELAPHEGLNYSSVGGKSQLFLGVKTLSCGTMTRLIIKAPCASSPCAAINLSLTLCVSAELLTRKTNENLLSQRPK